MSFTFIVPQIAIALRKESALVMAGAIALSFGKAIAACLIAIAIIAIITLQ